ncbi:sugar ABC transporter substrate-binding protein [Mesorhizobium sp. SEMIA 3007]|uniref:Sugar ABC transporter substrate-binding protein n=1 Tax=Mesorhizobium jarvisii TaxID=1777867 RepID=A0A6M7TM44_9HYPH|nr:MULTISPECIES: sugar ABC transporter substrate-binding protein [Mesorhizobium]AID30501.1 substrate-binding domain-containing protein [Mesorhizobium huakuii 7653R]MCH4559677.1 sugar ABC transporter substrate-binding protein [Mesorhizobium jarvisii]OBQ64301.1 sugar ABC transporter substrate-binding protein [Mesorhizobium loti]ODA95497.1 sugar ABC transporter substrate-binding protein [Mesorhizobium sp. SEMIA 3007]QKC64447.1 sugar ABC transporter substrate-binding protein [Mesorhizobium jarvisi
MGIGLKVRRLALLAGMAVCASGLSAAEAAEKHKIFLSMSYIGNDWQAEAANMVKAMAAHKSLADKVDLQVQVAGPNAQRQIQQINAMVQSGAEAIVVYPISPTALNQVVKNACDKGVKVFAYDAEITEPCAYNVHIDQLEAGRVTAEWLVKKLNGKGNIIAITGVPGTSVDDQRTKAAKEVFAKYPDIKIVGEAVGMWSQAVARTELSKILATRSWNDINGLWMQVGCFTANSMQLEAGKKASELLPCAGEGSNGGRIQMLPASTEVEGAAPPYAPAGAQRISYASPPYSGALALKLAVEAIEGKDVPKTTILPLPVVTNETIKLCDEGTWAEMKAGCNVFKPSLVSNPGWFASIFSDQTPEIGLNAALVGQPEN